MIRKMKTYLINTNTMTCTKVLSLLFSVLLFTSVYAQDSLKVKKNDQNLWKSLAWGFSFDLSFGSMVDDNSGRDFFTKPNIGGGAVIGYYVNPFLGIETGASILQRGSGIRTPDYEGGLGNADSTYRLRLRFTNLQIPISLHWRTPLISKKTRITGSFGYNRMIVLNAQEVFHSVEDGFHLITDVEQQYIKSYGEGAVTLGLDINANDAGVFRVVYSYNFSLENVYSESTGFKGNIRTQGLKLQWIY